MDQIAQSTSLNRDHATRDRATWHALYHAALFETDRSQVSQRIAEAEKAILSRIKELFLVDTDHIEEDLILDDALYALRALRNCTFPESDAA
jgi:hypothetical protein